MTASRCDEGGCDGAGRVPARASVSRARALARLLRVVLHLLHGLAIATWAVGPRDPATRRARVHWWSRKLLRLAAVELHCSGAPVDGGALLVANHVSWLDIVVIHAVSPQTRFVSKADVQRWPLLRGLADAADTLYLQRERRRDALRVVHAMAGALADGDLVAVFPEGTTGEGPVLLPFHANLLQAAITAGRPLQPVALRFSDPAAVYSDAVVYVGDTSLFESLWRVVSADRLRAHLQFLPACPTLAAERRALADAVRSQIAAALPGGAGEPAVH